jgi:hypothetical protein
MPLSIEDRIVVETLSTPVLQRVPLPDAKTLRKDHTAAKREFKAMLNKVHASYLEETLPAARVSMSDFLLKQLKRRLRTTLNHLDVATATANDHRFWLQLFQEETEKLMANTAAQKAALKTCAAGCEEQLQRALFDFETTTPKKSWRATALEPLFKSMANLRSAKGDHVTLAQKHAILDIALQFHKKLKSQVSQWCAALKMPPQPEVATGTREATNPAVKEPSQLQPHLKLGRDGPVLVAGKWIWKLDPELPGKIIRDLSRDATRKRPGLDFELLRQTEDFTDLCETLLPKDPGCDRRWEAYLTYPTSHRDQHSTMMEELARNLERKFMRTNPGSRMRIVPSPVGSSELSLVSLKLQ